MDAANSLHDNFEATLPPEIVDHIFRYACVLSTSFCLALSQSSVWTREIAIPYLYSTIVVTKKHTAMLLPAVLRHTPINSPIPNFLPQTHVRSIWLEPMSDKTLHIYRSCDSLCNLALSQDNFNWIVFILYASSLRLSVLPQQTNGRKQDFHLLIITVKSENWSNAVYAKGRKPPPSIFNKITHLRIGQIGSYSTHLDIAHLTRLSHIAIPFHDPQKQVLNDLLGLLDMTSVTVLVVVILTDQLSESEIQESLEWIVEQRRLERTIYGVLSKSEDLRKEWEEEARNGTNIWDRAVRYTESLSIEYASF
ncbi:hypothetical protein HYPSUDRAFT_145328 [Hypholoma sublateritium FD-334 SS-4]|uniref:F-box domain-containing protein n=1 Tax=Hypholoma sublateritium (strain FD-334 SS-4) TaxID=945553 RepID=A0A0D2KUC7_HYPSF|nr:hypothetical protein HYPSUDRAFT_145328 [Hypholoma sublateritium FD-334 SS-4]